MKKFFKKASSPLLSAFLMVTGVTFLTSFFPIYMDNLGHSKVFIGLVSSSYYLGMIIGAFKIESTICRIGHIRAFAAFLSSIVIFVTVPSIWNESVTLFLSRFVTGFCLAGLYITLESWFLSIGTSKTRGMYLSAYMSALGFGSFIAPFLMNMIDIKTNEPFSLSVLFLAAAIIPLTLQKTPAPEISPPSELTVKMLLSRSPLGALGCLIAGFCIGSMQSFLPAVLNVSQISTFQISTILGAMLLGNLLFQYPIGYISDRYDRRYILAILSAVIFISSMLYATNYLSYSILSFLGIICIGGAIFSLYPLAISYACDSIEQGDIVKATQSLLLFYGAGAVLGPIISSLFIKLLGGIGLFCSLLIISAVYFVFVIKKILIGKKQEPFYQHTVLPRTTPVVSELDPRSEEDPS